MRRVAITGIGAISALGSTVREFWDALAAGRCGIGPIEQCDASSLRFRHAAEVRGYRAADHFEGKKLDYIDRFAQFAVIAGREAVAQAGIAWSDELRERTAIVTGACVGGQTTEDVGFFELYAKNNPRVNPLTIPRVMANAGASHLSMEFGVTGPAWTVSTACASSAHAIGQAFQLVRSGAVEMAITGGSEALFSLGHLKAWEAMRVVSPDTCRPFSRDRSGMILGEGGGMLVLEPLDAALARGAEVLGEIAGFGMSADAHHLTQPSAEGAARAMRSALRDAGVDALGYVNAHGTATQVNDVTEARAIRAVFGDRVPLVSSTKSMHGHALGAAGALETIATVLALRHGVLPPTVNWREEDPEVGLDVCANEAREVAVEWGMSNSFAFGGLNAVLVVRRA
jgi:nodulation protein E